jgi:hypothetical protein
MNQLSCTLDTTIIKVCQAREGSIAFGVPTNLKPSSWRISHTKNCQKWIRNEKVMAPQNEWGQKFKKTNH